MTDNSTLVRMAAFPDGRCGGNPAGVVLDASRLTDGDLQAIATDLGYAETAFVVGPVAGVAGALHVRYFSPVAEVPFCGHATIATAVVLAERQGTGHLDFHTPAGVVATTTRSTAGGIVAEFTSPEPRITAIDPDVLRRLLQILALQLDDLSDSFPPRLADAGNVHPVLALRERDRFDTIGFDPTVLRRLMVEQGWAATVTILFPLDALTLEARNLFPVGTMNEDPATGSAAAAVGGYLRALDLVEPPARIVIRQGHHVGIPCRLEVAVPPHGGITVSGSARHLAAGAS
ncbi:PhzF family phenazine biosynthesis protein [uncultured Amnibacterium sp.]|uniref:PhzF family phenazine biosynthesis protein n=1 Tax=uncultured Amnibacterium sp. TaxID=1631851 RepID=UPI0035CA5C80